MQDRLNETARFLEREGYQALVAFNNGQNLFLDSNAVFVLSGVRPIAESAVVVERSGQSTLLVGPAWDAERAAAASGTGNTLGCDDLAEGLSRLLRERRIDSRKLVTVGLATLPLALARRLESVFGGLPASRDGFVRELAKIRNAAELAAVRKAAEIAERGYQSLLANVRPGMREFELAASIYCDMKALGAEDNFLLMSASQHAQAARAAGHRRLDVGDVILSEITPCYQGQFAQICRTTVIGEPSAALRGKYAVLKAAMRRGQSSALPGATMREVTRAINECFREAGYGAYCRPPYMRVRGHGLGITSDLPGDIAEDNDVRLEQGMVFAMHPNQYIPETGYLLCGETVVITPDGAQSLSAHDAELDFIEV